jgi:hypothetical protein
MAWIDIFKIGGEIGSGVGGVCFLATLYFQNLSRKEERSIADIVGTTGLTLEADGVVRIIRQFKSDQARIAALRDILKLQREQAELLLNKLKKGIDLDRVARHQDQGKFKLLQISSGTFTLLCVSLLVAGITASNPNNNSQSKSTRNPVTDIEILNGKIFMPFEISHEENNVEKTLAERINYAEPRLEHGYTARTAIRFVPVESILTNISLGENSLGRPETKYIFVGDYDELKGLKISEALNNLGLENFHDVYAIIFNVQSNDIQPGSVRGIFKVIDKLDNRTYRSVLTNCTPQIANDLTHVHNIQNHGLQKWASLKADYVSLLNQIRYTKEFETDFSFVDPSDWEPEGFSRVDKGVGVDFRVGNIEIKYYGAMVFLTTNSPIKSLQAGAVLRIHRSPNDARIPTSIPLANLGQ